MDRNHDARERGPERTALPVSPELLRLLFSRRRAGNRSGSDGEGVGLGEGEDSEDDDEGCRVS
jgi:hypothetical protein